MRKRPLLSFAVIAILAAIVFPFGQASAATITNFSTSTLVSSGVTDILNGGGGQMSAGNTFEGASASAGFYGTSPVVSATANSSMNLTKAVGAVLDQLVFSGPPGEYGDVSFHIAGNWRIVYRSSPPEYQGAPWVWLGVKFYQNGLPGEIEYLARRSLVPGSAQHSGELLGTMTWVDFDNNPDRTASGTYTFDFTAHVRYGFAYNFGVAVTAEAPYTPGGHIAFIDDPVTIELPEGVTLTSLSGNPYTGATAAPVPPSLLLLAPGLIGLCLARRRFTR